MGNIVLFIRPLSCSSQYSFHSTIILQCDRLFASRSIDNSVFRFHFMRVSAVRESECYCWEIVVKLFCQDGLHRIQKAAHPSFLLKRLQGYSEVWKYHVQSRWHHSKVYQGVRAYRDYLQTAWFGQTIEGYLWGERSCQSSSKWLGGLKLEINTPPLQIFAKNWGWTYIRRGRNFE